MLVCVIVDAGEGRDSRKGKHDDTKMSKLSEGSVDSVEIFERVIEEAERIALANELDISPIIDHTSFLICYAYEYPVPRYF